MYIIYNMCNIQVRPDGDWDDVICDNHLPYVCQTDLLGLIGLLPKKKIS